MKLEQQVASLELAKQLKEAGYPQEGVWLWICEWGTYPRLEQLALAFPKIALAQQDLELPKDHFSLFIAPTVAELGERILNAWSYKPRRNRVWKCRFNSYRKSKVFETTTEANARAKMWLHLKEKNKL